MNYLSDFGEFQEVDSNNGGTFSHVPGQTARIPSPRSMLSCDKRSQPETWNPPGLQEMFLKTNPRSTLGSLQMPYQETHPFMTPSAAVEAPTLKSTGSQTLICWTRRLLLLWTRSSKIPTSRRRSVSENRKPPKKTGFYEEYRSPSWSATTVESLVTLIKDGTKIQCRWQEFQQMTSGKVCTHQGYESLINSKTWTTWRFIRRYRRLIIKNWRRWWKGATIRNVDYKTLTTGMGELNREPWKRVERDQLALKEEMVYVTSGKKRSQYLWRHEVEVYREKEMPEAEKPVCEIQSTAVWVLLERYLHEIAMWVLASSRMSVL